MRPTMFLVCISCLIASGCERPKVAGTPAKITNKPVKIVDEKGLKENLAELDRVLKENAPFIHAKLAPPATEAELSELRAGVGGVTLSSLESWFQWHNGCTDRLTDLLPLGRMLSISESLQDRKQIQKVPFVDSKRKNALKILDDGSGDGFFIDVTSSAPRVFYYMLEDPYPTDYGTIPEFVQFIIKVHAAEIASLDSHGMVDFDPQKYDALENAFIKTLESRP
ncbi:MAG: hypothetical protein DHS20C16_32910 [Phycisphaerae bacterium]|nr:MAG: hypothetical protein DHS20C16_32910 [Phycisphaerae bacterium]